MICRPGETIAVDGEIVFGTSNLDESFITGESKPVSKEKGNKVVIYQNGEKVQELPLYQETAFSIKNRYTNKIVVKGNKAAIVESDCPGEDCVHSGWISGKGRSLVCLPNRVEIRIEGEADSEVDFIVR